MTRALRLLYAEDHPPDRDLAAHFFSAQARDIELELVPNGTTCLDRLRQRRFDVLLLDNHLPDMEGVDVLKAIAEQQLSLPVVMVTAIGDEELAVQALRLGACNYVPKSGDYLQRLPAVLRSAVDEFQQLNEHTPALGTRHARMLYVERHPADIDLTTRHLAEHAPHFTVEVTRSTHDALELMANGSYDLVLTDLRMPDMSALDLLREVRHRPIRVPVVVVTGMGDEMAAVAALKLGAADYIVKREGYLTQLPYALENAIARFQLAHVNHTLRRELAERERAEAERAHLAEQLRQSQKIDSLGRLAGGVAHDFNNLLTVIIGNVELMSSEVREVDPLRESLEEIRAAASRAADLTRQLLAFSRKQLLLPRVLDLNVLITESVRMLKRLLGEDIELVTVLDPALGLVRADPGQLDQVIVNLAVNARDAMPQGGRLVIETRNADVGEEDAQRHASFQPGPYVMMAISDSGHAMDAETQARIFEPFFTTKEQGKGTGLGLSMVYGIVKQSGGWIWVYSEPAHGTTFRIYLPRTDEPADPSEKPEEPEARRGTETILVVEDEEAVRRLTCHALRKYGYSVIEAANGGEALIASERMSHTIPLMITDVVMPNMSGPELAARLRQHHPEMKVLYTSGYTDDAVVRHGLLEHTMAFLQKPFAPHVLVRKVRELLDSP